MNLRSRCDLGTRDIEPWTVGRPELFFVMIRSNASSARKPSRSRQTITIARVDDIAIDCRRILQRDRSSLLINPADRMAASRSSTYPMIQCLSPSCSKDATRPTLGLSPDTSTPGDCHGPTSAHPRELSIGPFSKATCPIVESEDRRRQTRKLRRSTRSEVNGRRGTTLVEQQSQDKHDRRRT